jgi:hypothetical protein
MHRIIEMPILQFIGGTAILSICGWLASRV